MGEDAGAKYNEKQFAISKDEILKILKAQVAGYIWQTTEFYRIINEGDKVIERAVKVLSDKEGYNKILGFK
jgi:hypothetical protein